MPFQLLQLPAELQLRVAELAPDDDADRAALCLAVPSLGRAAVRSLPAYQGILLSVGLRLFGAGAAEQASPRWRWRYATLWQRTLPHSWSGCRRRCTYVHGGAVSKDAAHVPNFLPCKLQMHFQGNPGETRAGAAPHGAARGTLLSD